MEMGRIRNCCQGLTGGLDEFCEKRANLASGDRKGS